MTSRLAEMQARFQQKQMQEREEKLLKLYETQQQRAFERVGRGSAGSNTSVGSTGGGKVRQMFDERRQKAGVDRSYPLEPLKAKSSNGRGGSVDRKSNVTSRTVVKSTVSKSLSSTRNGKPTVNKREVVHSIYNNNDGDESFEQHKFEDDNADLYNSNSHREMIEMMNKHNLNDSLDNEEMPHIGFDEVDEPYMGKLANVGKLPSQNGMAKKVVQAKPPLKSNGIVKKEVNPVVRKPARAPPARTSPAPRTASSPVQSPRTSTPNSPAKSPSATMSNKAKSPTGSRAPSNTSRAPSNSRPSTKQSNRSAVARDDLAECNFCGRRFATDRLPKHEDICSKTGKKKRKAYDATKHRVLGTELESYVMRGAMKGKPSVMASSRPTKIVEAPTKQAALKAGPKKDWRRTHEEFISAIRAAKHAQAHLAKGGKLADLPPPPPSSNPDYVQCPHCGRRFNEAAAERHIPKCADYQFNKPKPGGGKPRK